MHRSSIGARLVSVGSATLLIAGILAQATPVLAASPAHPAATPWGAATQPSGGQRGPVRHASLRSLAAKQPLKVPNQAAAAADLAKLTSPAAGIRPDVAGPPDPDLATASGAPAAATPVAAAGQVQADSGGITPADPAIAAGPDHLIQTDNVSLDVTDRAGESIIGIDLPSFFGLPESPFTTWDSDPRISFDPLRQRWVISELSWDCATNTFTGDPASLGHGYIDFAISDTADPIGNWTFSYWFWNDFLPVAPNFGSSADKFGLAASVYAMDSGGGPTDPGCVSPTFVQGEAIVQDWSKLTPGFTKLIAVTRSFPAVNSPRIATQEPVVDASLRMIGVGTSLAAGDVNYINVTGSAASATVADQVFDLTAASVVPAFADPPDPLQSGGTLSTIDGTPDSVAYRGGILAFASTYPCTPTGDSTTRDCVRVTTLGNAVPATQPTRLGDTLLGTNTFDSSFGGVAFDGNGALVAAYTRSSSSTFASSYAQYNLPTDAATAWSAPQLLTAGAGTSTAATWGNYNNLGTDPQDPSATWVGDAFAASDGSWSTSVHELVVGGVGAGYFPLTPVRVLDSRNGTGLSGLFSANVPRTFAVGGTHGIPANAVAITGNLTVTGQTAAGYVSLTPSPTANPPSSTLNFPVGDNRANNVTIALGAGGTLSAVYKAAAGKHTHVILDVTGYFLAGSGQTYTPLSPVRVLDSRSGTALGQTTFQANVAKNFLVADGVAIPSSATAVTANLTVTGQTKAGYVSLTPTDDNNPTTSTINFPVKDNRANGLTIPLDPITGKVSAVYKAASGTVDLILDVTGYYSSTGGAGLLFHPLNPGRRIDTRLPLGFIGFGNGLSGPQGTTSRSAEIAGHDGVPATAAAITGNLTVTAQTGAGFVSVTDTSVASPTTSTINFPLADNRANGITVPLGSGDLWFIYEATASKHVQLILDITGYFE